MAEKELRDILPALPQVIIPRRLPKMACGHCKNDLFKVAVEVKKGIGSVRVLHCVGCQKQYAVDNKGILQSLGILNKG